MGSCPLIDSFLAAIVNFVLVWPVGFFLDPLLLSGRRRQTTRLVLIESIKGGGKIGSSAPILGATALAQRVLVLRFFRVVFLQKLFRGMGTCRRRVLGVWFFFWFLLTFEQCASLNHEGIVLCFESLAWMVVARLLFLTLFRVVSLLNCRCCSAGI